ncbi:MAG: hypothetical protein ACTSQ6_09085, partial [Candidatus Heimdallarchaeaceae archaeon]
YQKIGNYWNPSNSIGRKYKIDGKANSKDIFILNEVIYQENTEFILTNTSRVVVFFDVTILTLIFLIFKRKRKQKQT